MHASETLTVLAIDDDPDDLAILRYHMGRMAELTVDLHGFTDPVEGLAALQRQPFDIVLLDYKLGSQTGLDVYREIDRVGLDLPVILVTDQGSEEVAVEALHAGVSDYVPKNVLSPKSIQRSIRNSVERARLHSSLRAHRSELEQRVRELRKSNDEIQSFYHSLSHELKTPLTAVHEFVSIVLDGLQGPLSEEQRDSLMTAKAACNHMTSCINDIIDASRIETGKLALSASRQSIDHVLRQAVTLHSQRAAELGIVLTWERDGDGMAFFDERRLLQVVSNLIDNALKFTDSGGSVRVRALSPAEQPDHLAITVTDTGRGIAEADLERIFERTFQSGSDDAAVKGGLGLGLHICRELVHSHQGTLTVRSALGQGSEFTCLLPTQEPAPEPAPTA